MLPRVLTVTESLKNLIGLMHPNILSIRNILPMIIKFNRNGLCHEYVLKTKKKKKKKIFTLLSLTRFDSFLVKIQCITVHNFV